MSFMKPEILTHPNLPKPLHGLSPREIMGQAWWDITRRQVYASTDFHCVGCGTHKNNAKGPKWLEAHEYFTINYELGQAEITSIEPLCHYCHNFIHSGRLEMIMGKDKTKAEVIEILNHGFAILERNNLKSFPYTVELAEKLGMDPDVEVYEVPTSKVKWDAWRLLWNGKLYKPTTKNFEEWVKKYKR